MPRMENDSIRLKVTVAELDELMQLLVVGLSNYDDQQAELAQYFYRRFSLAITNKKTKELVAEFTQKRP